MSSTTYNKQEQKTREQVRRAKFKEKENTKAGSWRRRRAKARLIPIWLRIILFILLIAVCVIGGAMFWYGILGDGNATDVFKESTWTHIRDLVIKK